MKNVISFVLLCTMCSFAMGQDDVIKTDSITNSTVTTQSDSTTTLKSPPASAITPTINTSNSDLCTFGVAGAIQTQILGISTGTQVRESLQLDTDLKMNALEDRLQKQIQTVLDNPLAD
jgi:hypothetical protein